MTGPAALSWHRIRAGLLAAESVDVLVPSGRRRRDAGFAVAVATRVREHGEQIRGEGFALHPLSWKRRGDGILGGLRTLREIVRLYRRENPDILYHVALKPVLFGGIAARLAFSPRIAPAVLSAIMGLGTSAAAAWRRTMRRP